MSNLEQHNMVLESVSPIGTEQWHCPDCERLELRLSWHAGVKHIVVNPGDEDAVHQLGGDAAALAEHEAKRLAPWLQWLDEVDTADWWG